MPATRAAITGAAGAFAEWVSGDSAGAPGRPLGVGEQAPSYFYDHHFARDPRVIAEAGGYKLFATMKQILTGILKRTQSARA